MCCQTTDCARERAFARFSNLGFFFRTRNDAAEFWGVDFFDNFRVNSKFSPFPHPVICRFFKIFLTIFFFKFVFRRFDQKWLDLPKNLRNTRAQRLKFRHLWCKMILYSGWIILLTGSMTSTNFGEFYDNFLINFLKKFTSLLCRISPCCASFARQRTGA